MIFISVWGWLVYVLSWGSTMKMSLQVYAGLDAVDTLRLGRCSQYLLSQNYIMMMTAI
jgi:hypothetical protein